MSLAIPSLGSAPRSWTVPASSPVAAQAALAFMDRGMIPASARAKNETQALYSCVRDWADQHAGGMRLANFRVHVSDFDWSNDSTLSGFERSTERSALSVSLFTAGKGWDVRSLSRRVPELERAHRGLGESALHALSRAAGACRFWIYTPCEALTIASWVYWAGCDDEKERLEEWAMNGEDMADVEIFKRADFDAAIPKYASAPRDRLRRQVLERIARRAGGRAAAVARAILELQKVVQRERPRRFEQRVDVPILAVSFGLIWNLRDPMFRIFDDWGNDLAESGEYQESFFYQEFGPDSIADLPKWLDRLAPNLEILRAMDTLAVLISDPIRRG